MRLVVSALRWLLESGDGAMGAVEAGVLWLEEDVWGVADRLLLDETDTAGDSDRGYEGVP